ncbi:MAG TPA: tetratricopeptide repeat protein, partial [Pyrinomonadaceae bacterium]|nr:tetratricopeptide repeat protein [Pyrinomonadaceae bacterium]
SELVAEALVPRLTGDERTQLEKRGTDNVEAYEAYLRGRFHWNIFTEEAFAQALEYYNRAIQIDPAYALAHAAIADYYNFVGVLCMMPFSEATAAARASALRALELDPTLAEAYSALGLASVCYDFDWTGAETNHQRSVELNPNNATGHQWYSFYLQMAGRFDEAVAEMHRAQEIDPLSSLIMHSLAWCYYHARRFDESLAAYRNLVKAVPNYPYGLVTYSEALRHVGQHDEAVAAAERAVDLTRGAPFYLTFLAAALAAAGRKEEARDALRRLEEMSRAGRYVSPYMLSFVHVRLGERERALELLEKAYEIVDGWLVWMGVDPELDPLRSDARFDSLLRRTENPAAARLKPARRARRPEETTGGGRDTGATSAQGAPAPPVRPRMTEDDEAQQLYVAGRYYATRRTAEGLRQAIERLERAGERDPQFALAHAELADCYALLNWYVEPPPADAWDQALRYARLAVETDDSLAEAHASLGFVKLHYERDWPGAERELRRAIELRPDNPAARRWYAFTLAAMGRHDEAVAEIEQARELSPRSPVIATAVANVLFLARRFDEAIEQCGRALELDPGSVAAHVILRWSYEHSGLAEEALATFEQERVFAGDTPTTRAKRAHVLAATGRGEEAREILRGLLANRAEQRVTAYELAVICSLLDERDQAFDFLAEAEREHAVGYTFVRVDPHLDNLRSDARFAALLERTGNLATPDAAQAPPAPAGTDGA